MRTAAILGFLLALGGTAVAQPSAYLAEVSVDSVPLRSGPGDQMPETGSVFRGARIVVDHEEGEKWVAVQPPRGQVSWIRHLNVGPANGHPADAVPRNMLVHAEPDCEIAYGKPGLGKPLDVRRTRIPEATIVQVIGTKVEHGGTMWYPIEPPDGDFRYLPKSAIRPIRGAPTQSFVVKSPKPDPETPAKPPAGDPLPVSIRNPMVPTSSPPANRPADWPNHPIWRNAEQAERAGDYVRAEQLYLRLASEMNRPGGDGELANLCYTRVHAVREKVRRGGGSRTSSGDSREPAGSRDLPGDYTSQPMAGSDRWAGPGKLRLAGFKIDGKPTYAIVATGGKVVVYAVAASGVDLDRYTGSDVEVYGTLTYPGDLRGAGIMTATQIRPAR